MEWPEPEDRDRWKEVHSGVDLAWAAPGTPPVDAPCRNCGAPGPKPMLLDAAVVLPRQGRWRSHLLECPTCGCAFAEQALAFDYEHNAASETAVAYHVEVGAGLWPIVRAIARLEAPPGSKYLEIGCGFGFALDYATRAKGWTGRGIDPSPIATAARDKLGLVIENRYFLMEEAAGTDADVIMAGEVVEHMADPLAFIRTLKAALKPGGTLVLTTPDRAALTPDKPLAAIVPILSVGAHVVLETQGSLRRLLELAGFTDIEVSSESEQLTAYASTMPLRLERSPAVLRSRFRAYLDARVAATAERDYVWWGFATRAHQEAVVDQDWATADRIWPQIIAECRRRFRFDPDDPGTVPSTRGLELWELPDRVPKALPGILYARTLQLMNQHGATLAELAPNFRAAAAGAHDLNAALKAHAAEDLATLGVERSARAALAAEAADSGRDDALEALAAAVAIDPAERLKLARRSLSGLTNAGRLDRARELLAQYDVGAAGLDGGPHGAALSAAERDTLFCLAMLDLEHPSTLADAARRFAAVRNGLETGGLRDSAEQGERVARDRLGARLRARAAGAADAGHDDALETLAAAIAADPEDALGLARRSLVGLTNAARPDLARILLAQYDVGAAGLDAKPGGADLSPAERDTLFCLAVLDLQHPETVADAARRFAAVRDGLDAGGLRDSARQGERVARDRLGAEIKARTSEAADAGRDDALELLAAAITVDPEGAVGLARRSLVGLVNAGRLELARGLLAQYDVGAAGLDTRSGDARLSPAERDTLFSLAVLDLERPETLGDAARRFAAVQKGLEPGELWNSAGQGERVARDRLGAGLRDRAARSADTGSDDAIELLAAAVADNPPDGKGLARRSLVGLTNAGRLDLARAVLARHDVGAAELDARPEGATLSSAERDTLFCLAVLDLDHGEALADAARRFAAVRKGLEHGDLWWSALRGECVAHDRLGHAETSTTLLEAAANEHMPDDLRHRMALDSESTGPVAGQPEPIL